MSDDKPKEQLSEEDAKLLVKTIADVEREEANAASAASPSAKPNNGEQKEQ